MDTDPPLVRGPVDALFQWYRDNPFDTGSIDVHALASSSRRPLPEELREWPALHARGFRGAGVRVAVVDRFDLSHGASVEELIRAIAPAAEILRVPLGDGSVPDLARAIADAGTADPDILNLSLAHSIPWERIVEHRETCELARAAAAFLKADPLRLLIASTGNAGLGVLGCPSLARGVRRIGASSGRQPAEEIQRQLDAGEVGTSFATARISGYLAVLASMYPQLSGRLLFDALGVVNGHAHGLDQSLHVELPALVRFFLGWVSEEAATDVESRRAILRRPLSAAHAAIEERAWTLVAAVEARRIGRWEDATQDPKRASHFHRTSVRYFEAVGREEEAARSKLYWAGSLMAIPRQWTVMVGPDGPVYLDPPFSQIEGLLRELVKIPAVEAQAWNGLCALYQDHKDAKEYGQALEFGERALALLGSGTEEAARALVNVGAARLGLARHAKGKERERHVAEAKAALAKVPSAFYADPVKGLQDQIAALR